MYQHLEMHNTSMNFHKQPKQTTLSVHLPNLWTTLPSCFGSGDSFTRKLDEVNKLGVNLLGDAILQLAVHSKLGLCNLHHTRLREQIMDHRSGCSSATKQDHKTTLADKEPMIAESRNAADTSRTRDWKSCYVVSVRFCEE